MEKFLVLGCAGSPKSSFSLPCGPSPPPQVLTFKVLGQGVFLSCGDACYDDDGGRGRGRRRRRRGKGGLLRRGTKGAGEGTWRGKEAERAFSHLREGDPCWRERAEDRPAAAAVAAGSRASDSPGGAAGAAGPVPPGAEQTRGDPGPRAGGSVPAAQAVTSSLSPRGRRCQQPEPDSLTSRRETLRGR